MRAQFWTALTAFLWCAGCGREPAATKADNQPVPVRVRTVQKIKRPAFVAVSGSVDARETVKVGFQVPGRIASIPVREGQFIKRGDVLANLDSTDYRNGWEAAKGQTAAARAQLEKALAGVREEELAQARIGYQRAEDEYNRLKQLFDKKSLAPNDFKKAEAAYLAAKEQYQLAQRGARKEDKASAQALLDQAEAGERVALKRIDDSTLRSPISGYVARKLNEQGETVAAGSPVVVLMDLDPAEVRVGVPESDIALVNRGGKARVFVAALPDQEFDGTVDLVGVAAEPQSRTFSTRILVPNRRGLLRAGMIAEARITGSRTIEAFTVPTQSVVRDPQGATLVYVYFPAQKRVFARRVEAGTVYGQEVEIAQGLKGDESIVVAGQQLVREGALVSIEGGTR